MNEYTKELLQDLIISVVTYQPTLRKSNVSSTIKFYMDDFEKSFVSISDKSIKESITVFNKDELYKTKPFVYFKAIVANKEQDLSRVKQKQKKGLGSLPKNII